MVRKILFQIHLWTGLGVGLYVVAVCVSGSVVVFRNEFYNYFRPGTTVVVRDTERLSDEAIAEAARRRYPGLEVTTVQLRRRSRTASADVWLKKDETELHRLFDPYDGADLEATQIRALPRSSRRSPSFMTTFSATARAAMSTAWAAASWPSCA